MTLLSVSLSMAMQSFLTCVVRSWVFIAGGIVRIPLILLLHSLLLTGFFSLVLLLSNIECELCCISRYR